MDIVTLKASGYTWKCPECNRENYTGPAPAEVRCKSCNGSFRVGDLSHRKIGMSKAKAAIFNNGRKANESKGNAEFQTSLFPTGENTHTVDGSDDIPF